MLEMNCKKVVTAYFSGKVDVSKFWCLIQEYKSLLFLGANLKLYFIRRQANRVASALARAACSFTSSSLQLEAPPCHVEALTFDLALV